MKDALPSMQRKKLPSMRESLKFAQKLGQGEDKILAHIHPHEAHELAEKYGYSGENPHTGLPQFGRVFSKKITKHTKRWLPAIGSLIGAATLGPVGAVAGGGLGGALSGRRDAEGHRKFFSNVGRGLGTGAMIGGGQFLGQSLGVPGFGGGNLAPVSQGIPSFTSGLPSPAGQVPGAGGGGMGGFLGGLLGGGGQANPGQAGGGGWLDTLSKIGNVALPAMAIIGTMKRKVKQPKDEYSPEQMRDKYRDNTPLRKLKPINNRARALPADWSAETHGEHHFYNDDMPFSTEYEDERYKEGGGRKFRGNHGGTSDTRDAKVSDGEYVMNSTSVSLLGDGNTEAGFKVLEELEKNLRKHKGLNPNKRIYRKTPPIEKLIKINYGGS